MISHNLQHESLNKIWASRRYRDIWSCTRHYHSLYTHSISL